MPRTSRLLIFALSGACFLGTLWFIQQAPMGPNAHGIDTTPNMLGQAALLSLLVGWISARAVSAPKHERRRRLQHSYFP